MMFAVRRERGGPWDWSRGLREQDGWDEHARFMDALVAEGFIVLGGPIAGDRAVMFAIEAESEQAVQDRLAADNWTANGMLRTVSVEAWEVLLDGRKLQ
jgi:uncharacterized protein YciI